MANTRKPAPEGAKTKKETAATKGTEAPKKVAKSPETKAKKVASGSKRGPLVPKTYFERSGTAGQKWKLVDANGQTLGRLATQITNMLRGKLYPNYTPHSDCGDSVVVINAEKIKLSGDKWNQKKYYHHTGYAGGIKEISAKGVLESHPERLIEKAVWRMMPKARGHMTRKWFSKLHVYAGETHPHTAQKPTPVQLS